MEVGPLPAPAPFPSTQQGTPQAVNIIQSMESSNRPGVEGPMTKWGTAKGSMQLLDGTAQGVAKQLGIPWQPGLMTQKTPEAAAYQRTLGAAYYQQGLDATGNYYDAARHYHGGPNRSQWGDKTNAYADEFMKRFGG
jgi:soluble lytic murein transglycosylase-like protein